MTERKPMTEDERDKALWGLAHAAVAQRKKFEEVALEQNRKIKALEDQVHSLAELVRDLMDRSRPPGTMPGSGLN